MNKELIKRLRIKANRQWRQLHDDTADLLREAADALSAPSHSERAVPAAGVDVEKVMAMLKTYHRKMRFAESANDLAMMRAREWAAQEWAEKSIRALLASAPAVPVGDGWIAVGDRLPEFGDDVLVRCRRRNGAIEHTTMVAGLFDPHRDPKRPVWMDTVTEASIPDRWEVTNWQPLPPALSVDGEG